jgi:prepilin-type N-terminal cleavage/methylation domain-containing protein
MIYYRTFYRFPYSKYGKSLYRQSAFTLIELVSVLVIVGILATTVLLRSNPSDIVLQSAKSDVFAALVFARETAMARSDGSAAITLTTTENTVDVRVNNVSLNNINQVYPLTFPSGIRITSANQLLEFNSLGETIEQIITLSDGERSLLITISGVGYAY